MTRCKHGLLPDQCSMCLGQVTAANQTRHYGHALYFQINELREHRWERPPEKEEYDMKEQKERTDDKTPALSTESVWEAIQELGQEQFTQKDLEVSMSIISMQARSMLYSRLQKLINRGDIRKDGRVPGESTVRYRYRVIRGVDGRAVVEENPAPPTNAHVPVICRDCGETDRSKFQRNAHSRMGIMPYCKACMGRRIKGKSAEDQAQSRADQAWEIIRPILARVPKDQRDDALLLEIYRMGVRQGTGG